MIFNLNYLTVLKTNVNLNEIQMLYLCNHLSLTMNHRKNLKYYIINMKVNKTCRAINDIMKKNDFLNNI